MTTHERMKELVREYYDSYNKIPPEHFSYIFHIPQNLDEVEGAIEYIGDRKFHSFVELGSDRGGSLWLYSNFLCADDAEIVSIDCTKNHALYYIVNKLNTIGKNVKYIESHSHTIAPTFYKDVDLLHIDAGHHYEGVKTDWDMWYPKVVSGGVIILHDTTGSGHDGPPRLRAELEAAGFNIKTFSAPAALGISVVIKE